MAGLLAVDWGGVVRDRRDVFLGGWTGIVVAASWAAAMGLATVAGALKASLVGDPSLSFRWAVSAGIGGWTGGAVSMLFGLATLAPACYTSAVFSRRFSTHWPRIRRLYWTWFIGGGLALVLIAGSWASQVERISGIMGAVFAPAVGAMVADYLRQKGQWAGMRPGVNLPGLAAWLVGFLIGLGPVLTGPFFTSSRGAGGWWFPPSLVAFVAAFVLYWLLAALGLERSVLPLPASEPPEA
jgi:purine-cytosine permease-like protein